MRRRHGDTGLYIYQTTQQKLAVRTLNYYGQVASCKKKSKDQRDVAFSFNVTLDHHINIAVPTLLSEAIDSVIKSGWL